MIAQVYLQGTIDATAVPVPASLLLLGSGLLGLAGWRRRPGSSDSPLILIPRQDPGPAFFICFLPGLKKGKPRTLSPGFIPDTAFVA